jgi:23S rRNA (cytosine1962-C5)-methyltransferase
MSSPQRLSHRGSSAPSTVSHRVPADVPGVTRVGLRRDLERSLRSGHPWIYREALAAPGGLPSGSVVDLCDAGGQFIARGLYDPASPIAFRAYTLDLDEAVDEALFYRRLERALALRRGLLSDESDPTDAFRWCYGEGDFLPGLIVDVYGPVAVLVFDGGDHGPARRFRQTIVDAVAALGRELGICAIYERLQRRAGGGGELLWGKLPGAGGSGELIVSEHGVRFHVDVVHGQKSGLFLDQRENRRIIRRYARGRSIWNGFSYTGGFSVYAALGGARRVVSVDRAGPALLAARQNFVLNGLDPDAHGFFTDDAFTHLAAAVSRGDRHDLVIVDPPSFAPTEKAVPTALAAYRELHRLALELVAPGGLLCAASCSSHVTETAFLSTLIPSEKPGLGPSKKSAGRKLRILELHSQPADHPTLPAFPEGRYLKFVLLAAD